MIKPGQGSWAYLKNLKRNIPPAARGHAPNYAYGVLASSLRWGGNGLKDLVLGGGQRQKRKNKGKGGLTVRLKGGERGWGVFSVKCRDV